MSQPECSVSSHVFVFVFCENVDLLVVHDFPMWTQTINTISKPPHFPLSISTSLIRKSVYVSKTLSKSQEQIIFSRLTVFA